MKDEEELNAEKTVDTDLMAEVEREIEATMKSLISRKRGKESDQENHRVLLWLLCFYRP